MKVAILLFPGTNREKDMVMAFDAVGGVKAELVWHKETDLGKPDLIVLPGGFSYGDYLRCGAMAAHSPIMRDVIRHAERGTPILGVCNGFQMLIETGLLPGALLRNTSLRFICKPVHIACARTDTMFTRTMPEGYVMDVPVAHGEGNYYAGEDQVKALEDDGLVAFRYCTPDGKITPEANPNGSVANIAGIYNKRRTILGMMPHPENVTRAHQGLEGAPLFEALCDLQKVAA